MQYGIHFAAILASASITVVLAAPAHASTADDSMDVDHLIQAYHQAVLTHDGERLAALFTPGAAWFNILSDEGLVRVRNANPTAPKVKPGSVQAFVSMVATSEARIDPQHTDLHIVSDGVVAAVSFNFRFFINGKEENRGLESWQLIRDTQGWRIASIVYSSTPNTTR